MKHLLVFLLLLCAASVTAQDVIVKKDGSTIVCRVVELTATEITYKRWSDLNGSNYVMNRTDASAINYENGKKVSLSEADNLYRPGNQNDGTRQFNDKALLALDAQSHKSTETAKRLRWIGGIGGLAIAGAGIYMFATGEGQHTGTSAAVLLSSVPWSAAFFTTAHLVDRRARKKGVISYNVYEKEIPLSNGSSLSFSADFLRDNTLEQSTLGLGLRYNF